MQRNDNLDQNWRNTIRYFRFPNIDSFEFLGNGCLSLEHMRELKGFKLHRKRTVPLSFYQNVVTSSYSMAFWNWMRWEAEIDWMALHGVNFPLALTGQEFIWVQVYREFGIEFEELADYFAGPAFLAWNRMGNLQGYAGPLPWSYIKGQAGKPFLVKSVS